MSTLDEDLKSEPLPISDEDRSIPSRIVALDATITNTNIQIVLLERKVSDLYFDRDCLLKRAKEVNIKEDKYYKIIEVPIYKKNRVLVDILKEKYADLYTVVKHNIMLKLAEKHIASIEKIDTFIAHADVKDATKDKAILAQIIPPNTEIEGYETSIVKR